MRKALFGAGLVIALLASCATVPPAQQDDRVIEMIDIFNTLPAQEFAEYAGVPFLFDEQVLYSSSDVTAVLDRAREAGLIVAPQIVGSAPAGAAPEGARFDVGLFYERLPEDARYVVVESTADVVTLIMGGEVDGLPQLLGIVRGRA
ncbi:MAG: hypothetical protein ACOC2Y_09130 [Spirochaetota bacterium]